MPIRGEKKENNSECSTGVFTWHMCIPINIGTSKIISDWIRKYFGKLSDFENLQIFCRFFVSFH